jgi:hypothetical protein
MEATLRQFIQTHGFRAVQAALNDLAAEYKAFYEAELAFLTGSVKDVPQDIPQEALQQVPQQALQQAPQEVIRTEVADDVKVVQITERVAERAEEVMDGKEMTLEGSGKRKMKVIRKGDRVIKVPERQVEVEVEAEDVAPVAPVAPVEAAATPLQQEPKRTPAEIKKWQRDQEAARRTYMKANKISRSSLMTVENVRKWLDDGYTYARIAREHLGCKEEEVSKYAKEHGLSRRAVVKQ